MLRVMLITTGLICAATLCVTGGCAMGEHAAQSKAVTRVYDIRQLLRAADPDFETAPPTPHADGNVPERPEWETSRREQIVGQIVTLIRQTVGSIEEWEGYGGEMSSVSGSNGSLIIKTTPENHEAVLQNLSQLVEIHKVQVAIESRFIIAPKKFFNEMDIGQYFAESDAASSERISFIDPIETHLIIRATSADATVFTPWVPRLMLADGKHGSAIAGHQLLYVADYKRSETSDGFKPVILSTAEGVHLNVTARVSEDHKQVTLELNPVVSGIARPIRRQPWPGSPPEQTLYIEKPVASKAEINTTVSMPDKGTLLMELGRVTGLIIGVDGDADQIEDDFERHVYMVVRPTIVIFEDDDFNGLMLPQPGYAGNMLVRQSPEAQRMMGPIE